MIWSGQGGTDIFFQNEMPYDPPNQAAWMANTKPTGLPRLLGDSASYQLPGIRDG